MTNNITVERMFVEYSVDSAPSARLQISIQGKPLELGLDADSGARLMVVMSELAELQRNGKVASSQSGDLSYGEPEIEPVKEDHVSVANGSTFAWAELKDEVLPPAYKAAFELLNVSPTISEQDFSTLVTKIAQEFTENDWERVRQHLVATGRLSASTDEDDDPGEIAADEDGVESW